VSVDVAAIAGCDAGASYFLGASGSLGGAGVGAYYFTGSAYLGGSGCVTSFSTNDCSLF